MRTTRPYFIRFGPEIPIIPVDDFSKIGLTEEQWKSLWRIVGPSVEKNMSQGYRNKQLELWQVIAAAYMEGLNHGYGIGQESPAGQTIETIRVRDDGKRPLRAGENYCWDGIPCGS